MKGFFLRTKFDIHELFYLKKHNSPLKESVLTISILLSLSLVSILIDMGLNEQRRKKTCLRCFRPRKTKTSLLSYRD